MATTTLALVFVLLPYHCLGAFNFSAYNACAQPYLYSYGSQTNCDYGDQTGEVTATNTCLCSDSSFLSLTAKAIGAHCGCVAVKECAETTYNLCAFTNTPLIWSVQEYIQKGGCSVSSVSSTGSSPPAHTSEQPASASDGHRTSSGGGGVAESNRIALGVGIGLGVPTIIIGVLGLWRKRRSRTKDTINGEEEMMQPLRRSP